MTWEKAVFIGAGAVILSIVGAMVLIIEGVIIPMAVFAVLLAVGVGGFFRARALGAKVLAVLSVLSLAATVPFAIESLLLVQSSVDFSLNLLSIAGAVLLLVASVAVARDGDDGGRAPRAAVLVFLVVMIAGVSASATLRLLRDDPLGRPGDVTVYAEDIAFDPTTVHADGDRITVFLENKDLTAHTFSIDRLDLDEAVPGGGSARIVFEAQPGSYEIYCSIAGHEEMTGTLEVGGSV